jgi:hypothetical protein
MLRQIFHNGHPVTAAYFLFENEEIAFTMPTMISARMANPASFGIISGFVLFFFGDYF